MLEEIALVINAESWIARGTAELPHKDKEGTELYISDNQTLYIYVDGNALEV